MTVPALTSLLPPGLVSSDDPWAKATFTPKPTSESAPGAAPPPASVTAPESAPEASGANAGGLLAALGPECESALVPAPDTRAGPDLVPAPDLTPTLGNTSLPLPRSAPDPAPGPGGEPDPGGESDPVAALGLWRLSGAPLAAEILACA
ncbi:MAG TPA: hypothetical protein VFG87_09390, partial [Amycolatopsis sp.]|nr:hypothetical protein [Amycolatopsis sp.]